MGGQDGAGGMGVSLRWVCSAEIYEASRADFPGLHALSWVSVLGDGDRGPAHLSPLALMQPHLEAHLLPTLFPSFLCPGL